MPCRFPWTATVGSVQMVDEIDELVLGRTRDRRSGRSTTRFCTTLSISWAPRHHCVDLAAGTARQDKEVIVTRPGYSDRKSTRLNSSHVAISYAVFCLKKKKT